MQNSALVPQGYFETTPLDWPCGGFMMRSRIGKYGWHISGGDQYTPFLRKPGSRSWIDLFVAGKTYDIAHYNITHGNPGMDLCYEDENHAIFMCMHGLWTTHNLKSDTPTITYRKNVDATLGERTINNRCAMDPCAANNGQSMCWWNPDNYRFEVSTDGGDTFTPHPDIPAADPTVYGGAGLVAFDRHSSTAGGYTHVLSVIVPGHGMYELTNGLTSTAAAGQVNLISAAVTQASSIDISPATGRVFWATLGNVLSYRNAGSNAIVVAGIGATQVVCHPDPAVQKVFAAGPGGDIFGSANNGNNWAGPCPITRVADETPFGAATNENYMSHGCLAVDYTDGALWISEGIGNWKVENPPTNGAPINVEMMSINIRMMVGTYADTDEETGITVAAGHDRNFKLWRPGQYDWHGRANGPKFLPQSIVHCQGLTWSPEDPSWGCAYVGQVPWMTDYYGYAGSWRPMIPVTPDLYPLDVPNKPGTLAGASSEPLWGFMAAGKPGRAVVCSFNARPQYYRDGVWGDIPFGTAGDQAFAFIAGNPPAPQIAAGLYSYYWTPRASVCVNRANPDEFFIFWGRSGANFNDALSQQVAGVWKFNIQTLTCVRVCAYDAIPNVSMFYDAIDFKQVPGHPTDFFLSTLDGANTPTVFSNDSCVTWNTVPNMPVAVKIGFQTNLKNRSYPRITVAKENRGRYHSLDFNRLTRACTFTQFEQLPGGTNATIVSIGNDMHNPYGGGSFATGPAGNYRDRYRCPIKVS